MNIMTILSNQEWDVTRKQTLRSLSLSYQKKDGREYDSDFSEFDSADIIDYILGHARPSFFSYDNGKDLKVCFLMTRVK